MIKLGISKIIFLTVLKMEVMCPKDADRMANNVGPDQTAPLEQSDLGMYLLFRSICPIF